MEKEECQKIKKTISKNEEATKQVLKQRRLKIFNYLKQKPDTERNKKTSKTTAIHYTLKATYPNILKNDTNIASNSINQNTSPFGERPTLQQKVWSFTSKHTRSRSKSPTRKVSKINQQSQSNEIAALKSEIEELKQQKQNSKSTEAKSHEESNRIQKSPKQRNIQKTYKRPPKKANWKKQNYWVL